MSDSSGTGAQGADPRPRPQYGEYAPPGWKSPVPGEDAAPAAEAPAAGKPAEEASPVQPTLPAPTPPQQGGYDWGTPKPVRGGGQPADGEGKLRRGDLVASVMLLALGLVTGVLSSLSLAGSLGRTMALSALVTPELVDTYEQMGLRTEGVMIEFGNAWPILAGLSVGLWLITALLTVRRLKRRKLAFWVPLVGGAIFLIAQVVVITLVFLGSPDVVEMLSGASAPQS